MWTRGLESVCGLWLLGVSVACWDATAPVATIAQLSAPIVGGRDSDGSQNAVVLLQRGAFLDYCTAVVIAPTVVMTARNCLYGPAAESDFYEECDTSIASLGAFVWDPEDFVVHVGNTKPVDPVALGKEIYTSDALALCANDLALLELDAPLPVAPVPLRLDAPPVVGEEASLVGWGYTANDEPNLPDRRQQRESRVVQLGGDYVGRSGPYIDGNLFVSTEAGCGSDEGAPLISTLTHAVIGVQRAVLGVAPQAGGDRVRGCIGAQTLLERLDVRERWIRTTLRRLGTAPWTEGKAPPAELGASCADGDECLSGVCLGVGDERYCSASCAAEACPEGMLCMGPGDGRVCTLENAGRFDAAGGCVMARGGGSHTLLCFAVWLAAATLRRGARNRSAKPRSSSTRRTAAMLSANRSCLSKLGSHRHVSR